MSKAKQNQLAWTIAGECLERADFDNVEAHGTQGTFPHMHITARKGALRYFIGVASREEIGADGDPNPSYNIVKNAEDMALAPQRARMAGATPSFVAIALNRKEWRYSAYFGTLEQVGFRRSIPMLELQRHKYQPLEQGVRDERLLQLA